MTAELTATVKFGAPHNEAFANSEGYTVTLHYNGRRLTVPFYMGSALCREPEAAEVLECLISDTTAADQSFDTFCAYMGYDSDSRTAERTYRQCVSMGRKVRKFLGDDFDAFAYDQS